MRYVTLPGAKRPNKFHAKKCAYDGYTFDSLGEGKYYLALKALGAVGDITNLKIHPRYPLVVNDVLVGHFTPDFEYDTRSGEHRIDDYKGVRTEAFALRVKLFQAIYGLTVTEVNARPRRRRIKRARR